MTGMIALSLFLSYLLGSVPTGLWVGLLVKKVDIREHGSKNIGATNTLRVLGKGIGSVALIGDISKGVIAVLCVAKLAEWDYAPLACGFAAILGHTFSIFCKFKGGKGVATSAGVFTGLATIPMAIAFTVFIVTVAVSRMMGLASILGAVTLSITLWTIGEHDVSIKVIGTIVAVLIVIRHRENIKRMLAGEENKL